MGICASRFIHAPRIGLRRSFASLTERLDIPAGVVAQIIGHKLAGRRVLEG